MSDRVRVAVAGEGAFGSQHLEALKANPTVDVRLLVGGVAAKTAQVAERFSVPKWTTDLAAALSDEELDAFLLATPTPLHASQAIACLEAGKDVLVEIPMADALADAERIVETADRKGRIAMAGQLRRFNHGHAWIHERLVRRELTLRQLSVSTYFLRRTNVNLQGEPRSWTDSLLWHHACHSVDLFLHQTGEEIAEATVLAGPPGALGTPLDMVVQLASEGGTLASISLSFNHSGPQGSDFRYICDQGTYLARNDDLTDAFGKPVEVAREAGAPSGLARLQRAFVASVQSRRRPEASARSVLPAMRVLARLERQLTACGPAPRGGGRECA